MSDQALTISVITPCLNNASTIERAIQSVLDQDYTKWEHIIVDGESTDGTIEILKKYPHLKWQSEKDKSQEQAMNKGFRRSSGDIIVYLNADDYLFPGAFSAVIEAFKKGATFVVGNVLVKSPRLKTEFLNTPRITFEGMLRHWEPNAFCHNPVGYFYRREVQEMFPINEDSYAIQDLEFLLNAATTYPFTKIEKTLGCYEDGTNTKTAKTQAKLNYWQSHTFAFLDKFIALLPADQQEVYQADRRSGYAFMQAHMNQLNNATIVQTNLPLVSVIIPTYNCAAYIERAVDSVIAQGLESFEIIVINDASTDNTESILQSRYGQNASIKLLRHAENKKLGAARNTGLEQATGKYVFFLDADDWLEPNALKRLVSVAETYQAEITECGVQKVYEDGHKETYHSYAFACSGGLEALHYYADYMIGSIVWNKLYLRKFLDQHQLRFLVPYWHEDVLFTAQALFACTNYISIDSIYYNYFQRSNSISGSAPTQLHLESYIKLYHDLSEFIFQTNIAKTDPVLAKNLMQAHCTNTVLPSIARYAQTHPKDWQNDCINACYNVFGPAGAAFASTLISQLKDASSPITATRDGYPAQRGLKNFTKKVIKRFIPARVWRPLKQHYHKIKFKIRYRK